MANLSIIEWRTTKNAKDFKTFCKTQTKFEWNDRQMQGCLAKVDLDDVFYLHLGGMVALAFSAKISRSKLK